MMKIYFSFSSNNWRSGGSATWQSRWVVVVFGGLVFWWNIDSGLRCFIVAVTNKQTWSTQLVGRVNNELLSAAANWEADLVKNGCDTCCCNLFLNSEGVWHLSLELVMSQFFILKKFNMFHQSQSCHWNWENFNFSFLLISSQSEGVWHLIIPSPKALNSNFLHL